MTVTPFDNKILWVYWKGNSVAQNTIGEFAQAIKQLTPVVAGIVVKATDGHRWQGRWDTKPAMAINGPDDVKRWVEELAKHGLETHLWTVIRGDEIDAEAAVIAQACNVAGVKSMLFDVEVGEHYFGGQTAEDARNLITQVRAQIPADFHIGLNFDSRGTHPQAIHINEWLPHIQSLHPMVYHWHFSEGTRSPEPYLEATFTKLGVYNLPIIPMLQTYPDPSTNLQVPDYQITDAGNYSLDQGGAGVTLFRYGTFITEKETAAINQIQLQDNPNVQPVTPLQTVVATMSKYQVVTLALSVRTEPKISANKTATLLVGEAIEADPSSATEADGYVWVQHLTGWSAEGKADGSEVYLKLVISAETTTPTPIPVVTVQPSQLEYIEMRVVSDTPVRVRETPMGKPIDPPMTKGTLIKVDANSRTEKGGYIWWKHERGWSAETDVQGLQGINLEVVQSVTTPTATPTVTITTPSTGVYNPATTKTFQVIYRYPIWIRSQPINDRSLVLTDTLSFGTKVEVDADSRKESGGLVFWQHAKGWSVEKKVDGSEIYMIEAQEASPTVTNASNGAFIFNQFPLKWEDFAWFQYYGNTTFAFTNGKKWGYDKYAQGLHAGIDLGSNRKVPVYAGISGILGYAGNKRAYAPGRVDVQVGEWLIIYGHVIEWTNLPEGTQVQPDTIIGYLHGAANSHVHLEIRHNATGTIHNPLNFFEKTLTDQIIKGHPATSWRSFYKSDVWTQWQTPFDQPIIKLGGPVVGPTANR